MVRDLRKKGYNAVIIKEGPGGIDAEEAMMRAGFTWYFGDELRTIDRSGKVVKRIPLK